MNSEWYGEIAYKLQKAGYDVKAHQINEVNFDFDGVIQIFFDNDYIELYYDEWECI